VASGLVRYSVGNTFGSKGSSSPGFESTNECFLPHQAEINSGESIISNGSIAELQSPVLLGLIPMQRLVPGSSASINLENYISGAEDYGFSAENITGEFEYPLLVLTSDSGFKGSRIATLTASNENGSINTNFTVLVSSGAVSIKTSRSQIRVGEPVKWIKNITLDVADNVSVEIPSLAKNVSASKIENGEELEANTVLTTASGSLFTGDVVAELELSKDPAFVRWLKNLFRSITARVVADLPAEFTSVESTVADESVLVDSFLGTEVQMDNGKI